MRIFVFFSLVQGQDLGQGQGRLKLQHRAAVPHLYLRIIIISKVRNIIIFSEGSGSGPKSAN